MKRILLTIFTISTLFLNSHSQIPPGIPADDPFIKLGYIDVTLLGVDNSGSTVSTKKIQEALDLAQQYRMACYFPSGTYLVDSTLECKLPVFWNGSQWVSNRRNPVYVVGASKPKPVMKLVSNANGFGSETAPQPLIRIWAQQRDNANTAGSDDPATEQDNINFNMVFRNFKIDLNSNRGAIGIKFAGAQGSTVEDVIIEAEGAYAGFSTCIGQGGGYYNVEINGGDYAYLLEDGNKNKFFVAAGLICKNQLKEVFKTDAIWTPMVISGFYIEKESGGINTNFPSRGGMSFIDGVINYTGSTDNIFKNVNRNVYLSNVYMKNAGSIVGEDNNSLADGWNHVKEYYYTGNNSKNLIDGVVSTTGVKLDSEESTPGDYMELIRKHTWDPEQFISVANRNDANFVNVKDATKMTGSSGACIGDGTTDDTEALQWAINNFEKVFIPNGTFLISKPIELKANTQLLGAGKTYSNIKASDNWTSSEKIMIKTVADASATTSMSFILLEINPTVNKDFVRFEWRAGKNSIVRDIMSGVTQLGPNSSLSHQMYRFTGSTAGGRVYGLTSEYTLNRKLTQNSEYRHVLIENTSGPLAIYGCNAERCFSGTLCEIKNSSNVSIYYLKTESADNDYIGASVSLAVNNSNNIRLYALTGNADLSNNHSLVEVADNSEDVKVTHIRSFKTGDNWNNLSEAYKSAQNIIGNDVDLGIFSRSGGTPTGLTIQGLNDKLKVYPNPFTDEIIFETNSKASSLKLFNSTGALLINRQIQSDNYRLKTNHLNSGIYIANIISGDKVSTYKLVKR